MTYQLPVLAIDDIPQIALSSMNETHREEVELINRLGSAIIEAQQEPNKLDKIRPILLEWFVHTRQHFAGENLLMQEYNFPAFPMHSSEHANVLALIESKMEAFEKNPAGRLDELAAFIFESWPQWFHQHVTTMDKVTAMFVASRRGVL